MEWTGPFVVYRIVENGKIEAVFVAEDLKKAKYWLSYIAQPGDALYQTPAHPRNETGSPKYWSHKESSGKSVRDEDVWKDIAEGQNCTVEFCVA